MFLRHGKRRIKHRTIRWSILQNFSVLILLIAVFFFSAYVIVAYTQSTIVFSKHIDDSMAKVKESLDNYFLPIATVVRIASTFTGSMNLDRTDSEHILKTFAPIMVDFPQIAVIHTFDRGGDDGIAIFRKGRQWVLVHSDVSRQSGATRVAVWNDQLERLASTSTGQLPTDLRGLAYVHPETDYYRPQYWSDPHLSPYIQDPVISVTVQVQSQSQKDHFLAFDIAIKRIPGLSDGRSLDANSMVFLMTRSRQIVHLTSKNLIRLSADTVTNKAESSLLVSEVTGIVGLSSGAVMRMASELHLPILDKAIESWLEEQHNSGSRRRFDKLLYFNADHKHIVGSIRPYKLSNDQPLLMGYFIPRSNVRQFEHYTKQIFMIPLILCIALIFAFLMTKKMTKRYLDPLTKLVKQSIKISRMDLKKGEPIESEIIELQQLADSHEQMRSSLEEFTTKLKISKEKLEEFSKTLSEKVEERTLELQKKSQELEELNATLEKKVKKEVEASSRKDKIMFQSARQAQMGEMISMIAHQWRQPLSSISTVTGNMLVLLELDSYDTEQFKDLLKSINEHAQYLSSTINDFRNFFRPNKEKQSVLIGTILEQTINIIGKSLQYKNIALKTDYQLDTPISTYPNELTQVFLNIVKNAQDVIVEKKIESPEIIITGRQAQGHQIIEILDNAGGIPEDIVDKIFEPYFSTKDDKTGTGLGLYMSKLIIEKHCKGELTADNVGQGARFTITLPMTV